MSETIGALYKEGAASLEAAGVPDPEHDARALLAHVLDIKLNDVLLKADQDMDPAGARVYDHLMTLRRRRMPLQYVTRNVFFHGLEFKVDDRTLIPRQDTEQLVGAVISRLRKEPVPEDQFLADIGCGCGNIGLSIATEVPGLQIIMSDLSAPAVELAGENADRLGLRDRVTLLQGSYLEPLQAAGLADRVSVIVANPPYVRPREMSMLHPEVHAEPLMAIASPVEDGLEGYRIMASQASWFPNLRMMAFEVGYAQADDVVAIMAEVGKAEVLLDYNGIERVVIIHVGARAE